jgi:hypothetical protein
MDVQIHLDRNGDGHAVQSMISGRVVLRTQAVTDISTIGVIFDGEATSKVLSENGSTSTEVHKASTYPKPWMEFPASMPRWYLNELIGTKIIQQVQIIFPTKGMKDTSRARSYAVGIGTHVFPFQIKVSHLRAVLTSVAACF